MRRILGAAAIALSLGCVEGATGNGLTPIWLPSYYRLEAVDGTPIPVTLTTADGQTHLIEDDSLGLNANFTFAHKREIADVPSTRIVIDDGPFTVTREGRIVISEAGNMLTGTGSPSEPYQGVAGIIEFRTTSASAYGEHRYRFTRIAP